MLDLLRHRSIPGLSTKVIWPAISLIPLAIPEQFNPWLDHGAVSFERRSRTGMRCSQLVGASGRPAHHNTVAKNDPVEGNTLLGNHPQQPAIL